MSASLPDEPDGYWTRTTSPDGAYAWLVNAWDVKMSHWIMGGALWRVGPLREPAEKLFEAPHAWSFEGRTWVANDVLTLEGRRYPGRLPGVTVTLDVGRRCGTIAAEDFARAQARGSYVAVTASEIPAAPEGEQAFDVLLRWLEAFPRE